ncbi:DUF3040 domain-containing protein [Nonomuraea sp. NPDC048882]|uniref:DUF3040 domain-containing protein n=1 Tax=unclassified Nonomuraea TaxID=2593643 RepID=UPI000A82C52A
MDLSDRERRILGEIEQELRRGDRAFVRRVESLNAACRRAGAQRYAAHTTWRELWCVLLVALGLAALAVLLVLSAGGVRAPAPPSVPAPSHALAPMPALRPVSRARSGPAWTTSGAGRRPAHVAILTECGAFAEGGQRLLREASGRRADRGIPDEREGAHGHDLQPVAGAGHPAGQATAQLA